MLMTMDGLRQLDKAIIAALETGGDWMTRSDIATAIGRSKGLVQPADIAALERLVMLELIEARQAPRGAGGTKWEYRVKQ